jgi:hypothetical protein
MKTVNIKHADYSNVPSFARVVDDTFKGAAVLPNAEVMSACLRSGGRRLKDVEIGLLHDGELRSGYRIGGEFGELVLIDAYHGTFQVWDLGASDDDSEAAVAEIMAELSANPTR